MIIRLRQRGLFCTKSSEEGEYSTGVHAFPSSLSINGLVNRAEIIRVNCTGFTASHWRTASDVDTAAAYFSP